MGPCGDVRVAVQATLAWEEKGSHPRAQRGPVAGAPTQFSLAPSIGVFGFVPVWARSIFSSSRVVVRAWCLMPRSSAACEVRIVAQKQRNIRCKVNRENIMFALLQSCWKWCGGAARRARAPRPGGHIIYLIIVHDSSISSISS